MAQSQRVDNLTLRQRLGVAWSVFRGKRAPQTVYPRMVYNPQYGEPPPTFATETPYLYATSPAVYAAVNALANRVASTPYMLYRKAADGELEELKEHALLALLDNPNPFLQRVDLFWHVVASLTLFGNEYWFLAGPKGGAPTEIWRLNPQRTRVVPSKTDYIAGYVTEIDGELIPLDAGEVIHFKQPNPFDPRGLYGLSTLAVAKMPAQTELDMSEWNRNVFRSQAVPAGIVRIDSMVNEADFERLRSSWMRRHGAGAHKTAFIRGAEVQFENIGLAQRDVDFREGLAQQKEEIYRAFGAYHLLPPRVAGDRKVDERMFLEGVVWPLLMRLQETLNDNLCPFFAPASGAGSLRLEFDDVRPRERALDLEEQRELAKGLTLNEWRAQHGLEPIDGGDALMMAHLPNTLLPQEWSLQPAPQQAQAEQPTSVQQDDEPNPDASERAGEDAQDRAELRESAGDDVGDDIGGFADKSAQHKELVAWQKFALKRWGGQPRKFEPHAVPSWIAQSLQTALDAAGTDDPSAAKWLFSWAHAVVEGQIERDGEEPLYPPLKAIQATRLDFEMDFEDLLAAARNGDVNRRTWAFRMRTLLRKYGTRAYRDGLADGGVLLDDSEPLDDDDTATVNAMLAEQSKYVTELGKVLFKEGGVTDGQANQKPAMWFNKSIMPFYQRGRGSADRNGLYEWVLGLTEEHCGDCSKLSGQRHRMRHWAKKGLLPQSDRLECGGFNCDCKLVRVQGKARGRFLRRMRKGEDGAVCEHGCEHDNGHTADGGGVTND